MSKPSLMEQVRTLYSQGYTDLEIARKLGIYVSRIRTAISHIQAEQKSVGWVQHNFDFGLLEARVQAQLAAGQLTLHINPSSQLSPTGRVKPRMSPMQYYQAAKQLAEENRKKQEEEEANKAALREINPIAYVQAQESADLLDLMTHISRELSKRHGENYPST